VVPTCSTQHRLGCHLLPPPSRRRPNGSSSASATRTHCNAGVRRPPLTVTRTVAHACRPCLGTRNGYSACTPRIRRRQAIRGAATDASRATDSARERLFASSSLIRHFTHTGQEPPRRERSCDETVPLRSYRPSAPPPSYRLHTRVHGPLLMPVLTDSGVGELPWRARPPGHSVRP
jgi:hypothetical protein